MQGQEITAAEPARAAAGAQIIDLMEALKASLGKGKAGAAGGARKAADETEEPPHDAARRDVRRERRRRSRSAPASEVRAER